MHQHIHGFDETPIVATSLGPRCAIAMSTAIIRLPIDHSDPRPSRNVSRTAVSNRGPHIRNYFPKSWKVFAPRLGVVRGDKPDCSGERNLLTALIGLQRA